MAEPAYEVRTSTRRKRTLTAFREGDRIVVVVPAHLSADQRRALVPGLVERLVAKEAGRRVPRSDEELTERARRLHDTYLVQALGHGAPEFGARWVSNQDHRWGSCTPTTNEIRISDRLLNLPDWVVDYVLLHEVTHLHERDHNARFHALVGRYPDAERAKAFLEGFQFGSAGAATGRH